MVDDSEEVELVTVLVDDHGDGLVAAVTLVQEVIPVGLTDVLGHVSQGLVLHWDYTTQHMYSAMSQRVWSSTGTTGTQHNTCTYNTLKSLTTLSTHGNTRFRHSTTHITQFSNLVPTEIFYDKNITQTF